MKTLSPALTMGAVFIAGSLSWPAAVRAQSTPQPGVVMPRFELSAAARFMQIASSGGDRIWTGPGLGVTINRNATPHLAGVAQVETDFHRRTTWLGGAQFSTGFYYGSGRDTVPGRFFARLLAGVVKGEVDRMHPASQIGVGADVLLSRSRPVGLRWEVGYELVRGVMPEQHNGRVAIGLILGPHVQP